jgi:hypothetical protein
MIKINPIQKLMLCVASAIAVAGFNTRAASSEAMVKLLGILKDKGSISTEEYDALIEASSAPNSVDTGSSLSSKKASELSAREKQLQSRIEEDEVRLDKMEHSMQEQMRFSNKFGDNTTSDVGDAVKKALKGKWYETLSFRGYAQFRIYKGFEREDEVKAHAQNDRFLSDAETFGIRRGRFILSGDVSDHLYLYAQYDFAANNGGTSFALQNRDLYADIFLDANKEYRFRVGQSKVPYGFVNLQSSQNRLTFERSEALNTAVEGERDVGVFFMWTPKAVRSLYKSLVKEGLKGSGDYGVVTFGAYSGNGLNRADNNGDPHWVARLAYPFKVFDEQIIELGLGGYVGHVNVTNTAITGVGTPTFRGANGFSDLSAQYRDERVAANFVLYPKPFGIEAEWTWGRGPQLSNDLRHIDTQDLSGGYVLVNYLHKTDEYGNFHPFIRFQKYDGGRKNAVNAPMDRVTEWDLGVEWQPYPELEITAMYTHSEERSNTTDRLYRSITNSDRVGIQVQFNY